MCVVFKESLNTLNCKYLIWSLQICSKNLLQLTGSWCNANLASLHLSDTVIVSESVFVHLTFP